MGAKRRSWLRCIQQSPARCPAQRVSKEVDRASFWAVELAAAEHTVGKAAGNWADRSAGSQAGSWVGTALVAVAAAATVDTVVADMIAVAGH